MEKLSNNALNQLEEVMAEMDFLNKDIYIKDKKLTALGISQINKSPTLVSLLSNYKGIYKHDPSHPSAAYKDGVIILGNCKEKDFLDLIVTIGHELAHANGRYQHNPDKNYSDYDSAESYSRAYRLGEGEALYAEYKITIELSINWLEKSNNSSVWEDGATSFSSFQNRAEELSLLADKIDNLLKEQGADILSYKSGNKNLENLFDSIGDINGIMKAGPDKDLALTYDEFNKIRYLNAMTNIYKDYQDVVGHSLYTRNEVSKEISLLPDIGGNVLTHTDHIKSLVNKDNGRNENGDKTFGMFGNEFNNIIKNYRDKKYITGTPLALQFNTQDLLYGGEGDDYLYGSFNKDIVLGGSDSDYLYGGNGEDILGGNYGDDYLYAADREDGKYLLNGSYRDDKNKNILVGGEGNDHLYGGAGEDELFGDERLPEGEELKRESYESAGDDYLQGNAGNDNMYGGKGHDTYVIEDKDTIYDVDGGGEIWFVKESGKNISKEKIYGYQAKNFIFDENNKNEEAWISADDGGNVDNMLVAKRVFDDLVIKSKIRENDIAIIKDYFNNYSDGKLGITLGKKKESPPTIRRNQMGLRP